MYLLGLSIISRAFITNKSYSWHVSSLCGDCDTRSNARTRFFLGLSSSSSSCAFCGLRGCMKRFMSDERHGNEARARNPNNRPLCARRTLCAFRALLRTILGCTSSRGLNLIKLKAARSRQNILHALGVSVARCDVDEFFKADIENKALRC